jgi:hypothetical protein
MSLKNILRSITPKPLRRAFNVARCRVSISIGKFLYALFGREIGDYKTIPVIINNYNRLECMTKLIASLENRGYSNIYIIDNNSTYPPLLDYYKGCKYTVYRLKDNVGYMALWKTDIYKKFRRSFYVYTDSDVLLDESCPDDFMAKFVNILDRYTNSQKVGFGIRIDDLPDCFKNKESVIEHEKSFWNHEVENGIYRAPIDTTFALYRPFCGGPADDCQETYRTGFPYVIQHLPWYVDSAQLSEEEIYYVQNVKTSTHWSKQA